MAEINDKDEVMSMLSAAVAAETFEVIKQQRPFDINNFSKILVNLPDESYLET